MTARKTFAMFFAGVFLVQLAWIAAMPAFRGPDEFDHVFRAEGVAHGAIAAGESIVTGRGTLTPVRPSVVAAASEVCESYRYTAYHNCRPYRYNEDGTVRVASGAGAYNPAYYAVVGPVGRLAEGVAVNYVIRVTTAVLCAALLAWAAVYWVMLGRSRWRTLAFAVALTPVFLFSTAIAAPNGVSYAAALLLWTSGFAVLERSPGDRPAGSVWGVVVGAIVMCNTHTTGPLWLLLIVLTWVFLNPRAVGVALRDRQNWLPAGLVAAGALASAMWTLSSGANLPNPSGLITGSPQLGELFLQEIAWLLQTIAAFPLRNEMAPAAVYILWLVAFVMLLVLGFRSGRHVRGVLIWLVVATITVQTVLTYIGYRTDGYAWQGRYGLPFTVALALIPSLRSGPVPQALVPLYHCAVGALPLATAMAVWQVGHEERSFLQRPWTDYVAGGPVWAGLTAAVGTVVLIVALGYGNRAESKEVTT